MTSDSHSTLSFGGALPLKPTLCRLHSITDRPATCTEGHCSNLTSQSCRVRAWFLTETNPARDSRRPAVWRRLAMLPSTGAIPRRAQTASRPPKAPRLRGRSAAQSLDAVEHGAKLNCRRHHTTVPCQIRDGSAMVFVGAGVTPGPDLGPQGSSSEGVAPAHSGFACVANVSGKGRRSSSRRDVFICGCMLLMP